MRRLFIVSVALIALWALCLPAVAQTENAATPTAPPAIYLPVGGKVVTEINVSDDDVLGIIKQAIPMVNDIVKDIASTKTKNPDVSCDPQFTMVMGIAGTVDMHGLSEAIAGVKNVRVLIVKYPRNISPERFLSECGDGVQKAGPFRKILSDYGNFPGAVAIYALPENAGCMGFAYDSYAKTAYAVRVVGGVDIPKLIKWAGGIAKNAILQDVEKIQEIDSEESTPGQGSAPAGNANTPSPAPSESK